MENIIIIPARMESKRFPGKPLKKVQGKSLLQYTYELAIKSKAARVFVATPDILIKTHCHENDIEYISTSEDCINGTHRCAEAINSYQFPEDCKIDIIINLQVDEPCLDVNDINKLMPDTGLDSITTLVAPLRYDSESFNENVVKVVVSNNKCHWFGRCMVGDLHHIGIYAFPLPILKSISELNQTEFNRIEDLEQLTWIENGYIVRPILIDKAPLSINTPEDFKKFKKIVKNEKTSKSTC